MESVLNLSQSLVWGGRQNARLYKDNQIKSQEAPLRGLLRKLILREKEVNRNFYSVPPFSASKMSFLFWILSLLHAFILGDLIFLPLSYRTFMDCIPCEGRGYIYILFILLTRVWYSHDI